jgi:hypothetical protein
VRAAKVYIIDLFVAVALRFWDCVRRFWAFSGENERICDVVIAVAFMCGV